MTTTKTRSDKDRTEQAVQDDGLSRTCAVPNAATAAAIAEGRALLADPLAPRYATMEALKAALED